MPVSDCGKQMFGRRYRSYERIHLTRSVSSHLLVEFLGSVTSGIRAWATLAPTGFLVVQQIPLSALAVFKHAQHITVMAALLGDLGTARSRCMRLSWRGAAVHPHELAAVSGFEALSTTPGGSLGERVFALLHKLIVWQYRNILAGVLHAR